MLWILVQFLSVLILVSFQYLFLQVVTKPFKTVDGIIPFCNLIFSLQGFTDVTVSCPALCELWRETEELRE